MHKTWLEVHEDCPTEDIAGAAKVVQEGQGVCIRAIHLHGDGDDLVVSVEFPESPGEWTEVIREYIGEVSPISHIVEPSGIRKAREQS